MSLPAYSRVRVLLLQGGELLEKQICKVCSVCHSMQLLSMLCQGCMKAWRASQAWQQPVTVKRIVTRQTCTGHLQTVCHTAHLLSACESKPC